MLAPNHFLTRYRRTIAQAVLLVYVLNPLLVTAQVIVNAGTANDGRRTFVDQTQSGVTKINITTPNGAGVSHNSYQQFDVPKTGAVLNNGGNNSNTRIAGWVEGNPNLRPGQEAKLILNEVVGGKASQLQGYLEVAGTKADVIVANENGVTCNGCGFINTDRATLTTGKPVFGADGALQQMRVQQGQVTVGPDGLQAADTRVDILSRYANIQGDIHAANIQAVVGQNDIDYVSGQVTKQVTQQAAAAGTNAPTTSPTNAPSSGLDVGALGGMYANQISLVATGQGVGVKIDGKLLSAGQISIQSDGTLTHKGQTQGDAGVQLKAQTLEQAGQVISAQKVGLQAAQMRNTGTTQGQQLHMTVSEDASNSGHLKALDGGLQLQVGGSLRNESGADILSQSQVQINAAQVVNAGLIEANKVAVKTSANVINQGQIKAQDGGLLMDAGGSLQNQQYASIVSQSTAQVNAQGLINDGALQAQSLSLQTTGDATNTGRITAGAAGLQMQIGGALRNNKGGAILSQNAAQLNAMTLTNAGDIIATDKTTLHAKEVTNSGVIRSESALEISQAQKLDNSGTLAAKLITLQAATTQNSGSIEAQTLTLTGSTNAATPVTPSTLDNSGIMAAQNIRLTDLAQINNSGKITTWTEGATTQGTSQGQDLLIQTQQLNNAGGALLAQRDLTLTTAQLDNRSGTIGNASGSMAISTQGNLDNRSGSIVQQGASGTLHITAGLALNNANGHIEGQGRTVRIEAGDLSNDSGKILQTTAADAATVQAVSPAQMDLLITAKPQASTPTAGQLRNIQGQISSSGNVTIQAQSVITDPNDPQLSQPSSLSFMDKSKATSGTGSSSSTPYNWQTDIAAADKVNKAKAALDAATSTAATAATTLKTATQAEQTAIAQKTSTASQLAADQAKLTQAQAAAKAAQDAANAAPQDATLAKAAKDAQATLTLAQAQVSADKTADQKAATAVTQAKADVQTATTNKAAADAALVDAQTAYTSASAEVKPVDTGSSGSSTSAPDVAKPADLQLSTPTAAPLTRAPSVIQAAGDLQMTIGAGGVDNRQGKIQAQNIQISTDGNLWANQISALKTLTISAQNIEADSLIQATDTTLQASRVHNTGRIEGSQSLTLQSDRIDNTGTLFSAATQLQGANAAQPSTLVLVNSGAIQGSNSLRIASRQLLNEGTLSGGNVTVQATEQLENRSVIFSSGNMTLQGQDIVNNQARIYSMGDLSIESAQTGQSAGSLFNYAGRIEAQGDITIAADTVTNRAVLPSVNQRGYVEHLRDENNITTRATDTFNADGKKAEILSGKTLSIKAQTVNNDYGTLSAWHQVKIDAHTLNNTSYGAIQTENMVVKAACFNCHQTVRYADSWGGLIESGGVAELKAIVLNNKTTDTRDGFAGLSTDPRVVIVDERSGTQSPLTKAFVDRFGIVKDANTTATSNQPGQLPSARLLSDNLVLTAYGKFDFSRFKLPDGKTGLFETAPAASPYLIRGRTDLVPLEAGTQNTVYNRFLGSDYLMTRLGLLPGVAKRLGDAWYETQLVQEQLYAMTGRKYIVAGTSSDYDLMKGLMDAGVLAQTQLGLAAGQALNEQQQAALKQDMVWPEWQEVDGQRVLVPKVYLAHHEPSNDPANTPTGVGALIVGRKVDITAQDVNQEGAAIQAQELLSINASGKVSGSGNYSGGTSVAIVASSVDLKNASVQSAGWLQLETTQGDLNLTATQISAAGNATVKSAGELNLLADKHEAHVVRADGSRKDEVKYETSNITAGGNLTLQSANDLTVQGSKISAGQDLKVDSTGGSVDLQAVTNTEDKVVNTTTTTTHRGFFGRTFTTSTSTSTSVHQEDVQGVQLTSGGNTQVQALGNVTAESLKLSAGGDAALGAAGAVAITSGQEYSSAQTGSDVRQSLQTDRSQINAGGNVTVYGQQAVQLSATDVNAGGKALVQSKGDVELGYNTDTEQHNWTTSSTKSSYAGVKKKTTTTQHETADKTAEVTKINADQVQVLGNNVTSYGADLNGQSLVQVEGADKTALYAVNEEHLSKAASKTSSSFIGITYSNSKSSDSNLNTTALAPKLTSEEAIKLGVGTVTDVRGAIMTAPKIDIVRSAGADTSKDGELILGTSSNTTTTSHTESTTTAGVWAANSGNGSTTQTANQTQINGQVNIANGINTTVQIPEGNLKDQIAALSQQPGMGYLNDLASNPNIKWDQVKLAHDQWSYSQQGLTPAGAALLSIAIAVYTGGMGAELLGGTAGTAATQATLMGSTVYGAAANAGFAALAASAGVSFVNNGGDIGKTLKDMGSKDSVKNILIAMGTAGVGANVAGQGVTAVVAQTVTGCMAGEVSGAGCEKGATTAAVLSGAGEAYRAWVGYVANAGPGENRPGSTTGNATYAPIRTEASPNYGQQLPADQGMNVIGFNKPGSFGSQGGTLSTTLNLAPFINATAGLHDYIFNANLLPQTAFNNIWTMPASALIAIPAALNNPNISWLTQVKRLESQKFPLVQSVIRINADALPQKTETAGDQK
jgi:filamentous hemagglutinin